MTRQPFSVLVLAGGQSRRLGYDKVAIRLGEQTLLQATARRVAALTDDLVVVVRPGQTPPEGPWHVAFDHGAGTGLVAALAGGLAAARHAWALAIGCDMPFVSDTLIRYLSGLTSGWQAVIPSCARGLEPLHALYHRQALPHLVAAAARGERRLGAALACLRCRMVPEAEWLPYDPQRRSFVNVNTPDDLVLVHNLWRAGEGPIADP
ncbi:MAG: molybdenum cofactor guanylyltransferase [Chloroflexi bacterium]|nr:molybdenum cofactor guanylyltransferase [Chloroflexota bacterium]